MDSLVTSILHANPVYTSSNLVESLTLPPVPLDPPYGCPPRVIQLQLAFVIIIVFCYSLST